jgi:hypothetical protein
LQRQGCPACCRAVWAHGAGPAGLLGKIRICTIASSDPLAFHVGSRRLSEALSNWLQASAAWGFVCQVSGMRAGRANPPHKADLHRFELQDRSLTSEAINQLQQEAHSSGLQQSKQAALVLELFLVVPDVSLIRGEAFRQQALSVFIPRGPLGLDPSWISLKAASAFATLFRAQPLGQGAQSGAGSVALNRMPKASKCVGVRNILKMHPPLRLTPLSSHSPLTKDRGHLGVAEPPSTHVQAP